MRFIERAVASIADNVGEGKRWSGRTQSRDSHSPEQLRHAYRLKMEDAVRCADQTRNGSPLRPEAVRYAEPMFQQDFDRLLDECAMF